MSDSEMRDEARRGLLVALGDAFAWSEVAPARAKVIVDALDVYLSFSGINREPEAAEAAEEKNWGLAVEAIGACRAIRKLIQVNNNEKVEDAVARKIEGLETAVRDLVHEQDNFTRDLQAALGGSPTKLVETARTLMKSLGDTRRVLAALPDEATADAARRVLASFNTKPSEPT